MIISEIVGSTGLHRPTVYKHLPELEAKKLIALSPRKKRTRYVAQPPVRLKDLFEELKSNFERTFPEFEASQKRNDVKPIVIFSEGIDGMRAVFEDLLATLKRGEVFYRYSSRSGIPDKYLRMSDLDARREAKQLQRFIITNEELGRQKTPTLTRAVKVVPRKYGLFNYNVMEIIYADRVAILDLNSKTSVVIQNKIIADFQKKVFQVLYDKL